MQVGPLHSIKHDFRSMSIEKDELHQFQVDVEYVVKITALLMIKTTQRTNLALYTLKVDPQLIDVTCLKRSTFDASYRGQGVRSHLYKNCSLGFFSRA